MAATVVRHLLVTGLVQGVGYRFSTVIEAQRLGLDGWVRNRRDGRVEAVASGPEDKVAALIEWAHRGPPSALVREVEVIPWDGEIPSGFHQAPTA
ncbi:MAG TPA: acylphosphatase [Rhodocyclaceae bacterium]|nr:acylphosphatase [Rhodocyclaceae bacterium]